MIIKSISKTGLLLLASILWVVAGQVAHADSEVSGGLNTGLNTGLSGVVIVTPTATPGAGVYDSEQNVTLSASGASSIRYTTDGTAPTCSSGSVYSSPIHVASTLSIEAISCYPSNHSSNVAVYLYGINAGNANNNNNSNNNNNNNNNGGGSGGGGGGNGNSVISNNAADINHDGRVDILDFVALMANWGHTGSSLTGDTNNDSRVDILDFVTLMANWTH